jgi:hypothetical protein
VGGRNGSGKAGTVYTCVHQSGNDWKDLVSDLNSLKKALAKDPNCDNLLTSAGTSMSGINSVLSNPAMYYSLALGILYQGQNLAGTTFDMIGGTTFVLSSGLFQGSSEFEAELTILHELAHYAGVFPPENAAGSPTSAANDQTITKDCSKTLLGN